jgi:DNA-binding transcriptional LysR family regulator
MEYGQLRSLRELRDRGSIAAVATAFRVSPPAVSQQIAALQRSAGVALTRREGRRTVLTDAGLALADAADGVLAAMTVAREAVGRYQDDATAAVSVSALSSAAIAFFPALLAVPPAGAPTLELTDFDVARADYAVLTADIDLVIAHRLPGEPWPSTVRAIPLLEEPLDLAVRRGHPLDRDRPATLEELHDAEWVHVHESFPLADSLRAVTGSGAGEPVVRHRVNDWAITARLLAASNCVALMARHTGQAYLGKSLVLRPLAAESTVSRTIDILARPDTLRRAAARAVIDALQERANALIGAV